MKEYIKEKLLSYANNEYMKKYIEICEFYQKQPTKKDRYEFHHIFPAFLYRVEKNEKNRGKIIDELDKEYTPDDNIVKLPSKFHVIAHYCLGMALKTKESINAFQIFLKDYNTLIENYTIDEVKELAQMYEETSQPNNFDKYLTSKEKENYYKEKQKEYYKEKEKIYKEKQKEYYKKLKETNIKRK